MLRTYRNNQYREEKIMFIKLNQKGFSHHLIVPIVAVFVVGGIGMYLQLKSKAATNSQVAVSASTCYRTSLARNSKGTCVEILQGRLNSWASYKKISINKLSVDGKFGPLTQAAVKRFQSWAGLKASGRVDAKTWSYLLRDCVYSTRRCGA